ncbi:hypothetical protein ABZ434_20490 [Streptomyces sp. NPDC005761]|uniref:phage baseplate protein n=1 Tax=Streptomyces sp. NPDC005761 TaxID=3157066 RepID=UPI0033D44B83
MSDTRMDDVSGRGWSRRQLLRAGGGFAALAAGVGAPLIAASPAAAGDPLVSPHFVLAGNGGNPVLRATLHQPYWAMQSFAYDHVNAQMYFAQHRVGTSAGHNGDLWISRTDLAGNVLGASTIQGFGHGSSMGVEPAGAGALPYLWIEGGDSDDNGAGETLARFRYADGMVLKYTDPVTPIWNRTPTFDSFAKLPRPAIDPYANRLLIRYATQEPADRVWRIAVFSMADAVAGRLGQGNRIAERAIPNNDELGLTDADLFQGIALCGRFAYLLYGGPNRTSYLVTLDLNATGGTYYDKFATGAGASLNGREAQGMAIWMASGAPRLAFGYSSRQSTDTDHFEASVFYKSDFVN